MWLVERRTQEMQMVTIEELKAAIRKRFDAIRNEQAALSKDDVGPSEALHRELIRLTDTQRTISYFERKA